MIKISEFKKNHDWLKIWSGRWSLHFDSHQGYWWTKHKTVGGRITFKKVIYFYKDGITECWVSAKDKDDIGRRLKNLAIKDPAYVPSIGNGLKIHGRMVEKFMASHSVVKFGLNEFNNFWKIYSNYFIYHVSVKYIVDYLPEKLLKKYLIKLESARLFSEPVTRDAENYLEAIAERISKKIGYTKEMILSTTRDELTSYFQGKYLPGKSELRERYKSSSMLFRESGYVIMSGKKTESVRKIIPSYTNASAVTGQIAYKGKARGFVKVIFDPSSEGNRFKNGDILVTGMTRPEFLPLMKKAGAFVTDAGGILSHAAITAREMKKPCVIGTLNATKVFKDGDLVEVDANKGVVRKI